MNALSFVRVLALIVVPFAVATGAQSPPPTLPATRPDNYYAAGNRVDITRPMLGDVVVAGRTIAADDTYRRAHGTAPA